MFDIQTALSVIHLHKFTQIVFCLEHAIWRRPKINFVTANYLSPTLSFWGALDPYLFPEGRPRIS